MSTDPGTTIRGIRQIALPAQDLARATAFYADTLGLEHLFSVPGMAFFDCAGTRLLLGTATADTQPGQANIIYFVTDDIEAADQRLMTLTVTRLEPPHEVHRSDTTSVWLAFYLDSEGNRFALMSEIPI